jgi:hypothetical protein
MNKNGQICVYLSAMTSALEYRENAKAMIRQALQAFSEEERQDCLRMAAAWNTLADAAESYERGSGEVVPFDDPPANPLADHSDL